MTLDNQSLEDLLENVVQHCYGNIWFDYKEEVKNPVLAEAIAKINANYISKADLLRAIGSDENEPRTPYGAILAVQHRNNLRHQILKSLGLK